MRSLFKPFLNYFLKVDWVLLIFLILVLNVKILVKIIAIIILLLFNRKLFWKKDFYRQKFIWFYFSMILIAIINLLFNISSLSPHYLIATLVGIIFWLMCAASGFISYRFVRKTENSKLHETITCFFILNAIVTIGQLLFIIWDSGSINPYTYQGMHQKYFIGTGDLMTGISFDVSTTNAVLNAFGIVYFLSRHKMHLVLLCMIMLLLTASNFTNILLIVVLLFIFIFQSSRNQKSIILVCLFLLVIFMSRISPQNNHYVKETYEKMTNKKPEQPATPKKDIPLIQKPDSILNTDERKQKIALLFLDSFNKARIKKYFADNPQAAFIPEIFKKPSIPRPNIHSEPFQRRRDTTAFQKKLLAFAIQNLPFFDTSLRKTKSRTLPGKLIAFQQTFYSLEEHPSKIFTGFGMGNFSSKLAFRSTGLQMAGGYSKKFVYIGNDFLENHLNLYLNYFSKDMELHSLINNPNSVYDQIVSEYGLAGIFVFIFFYILFFVNKMKRLTYGLPLLLILTGAFAVEYWYEQLSIVIVFELLILLNLKETGKQYE